MSEQFIDPYFDPSTGYCLLQLSREDVGLDDEAVTYQGQTFQPKDEVHITILGSRTADQIAAQIAEEPSSKDALRELIEGTDWRYSLRDEWYHVVREDEEPYAESIIRMADVPPLAAFYRQVEELAGVEIPPRPAHVTLYTLHDETGIGIATWKQFDSRVTGPVDPGALAPSSGED